MTSNKFSVTNIPIKPPAYCKSQKLELPPAIPIDGPILLQGFAYWLDADAEPPVDISMYVTMPRVDSSWKWKGQQPFGIIDFILTLERDCNPNPWTVTVALLRHGIYYEEKTWTGLELQTYPVWNTRLLTFTTPGVDDKMEAQVTF